MKIIGSDYLAPVLVAVGLLGAAASFITEARSFRAAVRTWAVHDLEPRTELAATSLEEPLATGDFRKVREFGSDCARDGVRFTVFSAPGGLVFDSSSPGETFPEAIYVSRPCGEYRVRLGLPLARVMAPFRRARLGFILAAAVGGSGVLLVFLFTYRQRMRLQEMRKVERFRREFIADVSHEIKTPLTGILGAVDLLSDGDAPPAEGRRRLLDMIGRESRRLNELVQGILALARLERDEGNVLARTETDVRDLVSETVERLRALADEKGVTLGWNDAVSPVVAFCDAQLIGQAIANLVANAIRHSGSKDVEVTVTSEGGQAAVAVQDHGIGIPPEHRDRIFERFHRVDAARAGETGGSGLGLAIVRRIARLHGGDVRLVPVEPSGCRFVLTFPTLHSRSAPARTCEEVS